MTADYTEAGPNSVVDDRGGWEHRMNDEPIICASNNVDWYQAIFRSHGLTGAITDGIWISRDSRPAVLLERRDPRAIGAGSARSLG